MAQALMMAHLIKVVLALQLMLCQLPTSGAHHRRVILKSGQAFGQVLGRSQLPLLLPLQHPSYLFAKDLKALSYL